MSHAGIVAQGLFDEALNAGEMVVVENNQSAGRDVTVPVLEIVADTFV